MAPPIGKSIVNAVLAVRCTRDILELLQLHVRKSWRPQAMNTLWRYSLLSRSNQLEASWFADFATYNSANEAVILHTSNPHQLRPFLSENLPWQASIISTLF